MTAVPATGKVPVEAAPQPAHKGHGTISRFRRLRAFCDSGEPECIACGQFLGVILEVWDAWTEDTMT